LDLDWDLGWWVLVLGGRPSRVLLAWEEVLMLFPPYRAYVSFSVVMNMIHVVSSAPRLVRDVAV
jgi:hypothetical protein